MRLTLGWLSLASTLGHADGLLVDRVVAVVDLHAITRSDVQERAGPTLHLAKTDAQRAQARREALTDLIEEALIAKETERLRIEVGPEEVDKALAEVARQNQLTVAELTVETKRQGLDGDKYKELLRRKILDYKWVSLRANHAALPATETARSIFMASERLRLINELKGHALIEVKP